jgi:hypothetical protein
MNHTNFKSFKASKLLVLCAVLVLGSYGSSALAQQISRDDSGKDAISKFLLNFGRFIDWPDSAYASPDASFKLCIIGENHLGDSLASAVGNKKAGDHEFAIVELSGGQLDEAKSCNLLYISASEGARVGEITSAVSGLPVLTVGETDEFPESGGMIGLTEAGGRLNVRMAKAVIEGANLNVRSQLMRAIQ